MQDDLYQAVTGLTNTRELDKLRNQKQAEGGKQDMCKAIDDLMKDCREEGREAGCKEGKRSALEDCILEVLRKLGTVPDALLKRVQREQNPETLSTWFKLAVKADSIEAFEVMIAA